MRALSISRPWSELILRHGKNIENRSWNTHYRGPMLIHAARSWQGFAITRAVQMSILGLSRARTDYPQGIVGVVEVADVCAATVDTSNDPLGGCGCGPWAVWGQYHWKLTNPRPLTAPVPASGRLGLWAPDPDVVLALRQQGVFGHA